MDCFFSLTRRLLHLLLLLILFCIVFASVFKTNIHIHTASEMTPLLFWDFLCLYYRWMDITVEMSKYKKRIMLARSLRCLCLRPDSHFISFIHPFIQLKVLSHNFSLCCFFSLPFFVFLWPVWHRPTCTTQWAALYVIFAFVYRTHTICVFSCRVVFFISFIFITNIFMDCIWWTAVNPFGHWAREPKRRWHGIKIERLPCFKHYIR